MENGLMQLWVNPTGLTPEQMKWKLAAKVDEQIQAQAQDAQYNRAWEQQKFYETLTPQQKTQSGTAPQFDPVVSEDGKYLKLSKNSLYPMAVEWEAVRVQWVVEWQTPENGRWECWEFVNDTLGQRGVFGNYLADKMKNNNSPVPVAWGAFIEDVGKYGHVGIIENVRPDGTLEIIDSNYSNPPDWKIRRSVIQPTDKRYKQIVWFYDPSAETIKASDIEVYNSLTPSQKKDYINDPWYIKATETKERIFNDPKAPIEEVLRYSRWQKDLSATQQDKLQKYSTVLWQLDSIEKTISKKVTWPIVGAISSRNPYDTVAQTIAAELQAIIPWVARWVYGEVGVLTDADIENYRKTLPTLTKTSDVNDAILAMTLRTMANTYKSSLQTYAGSGSDVSWLQGSYYEFINKAQEIEKRLWISPWGNQFVPTESDLEKEIDSIAWPSTNTFSFSPAMNASSLQGLKWTKSIF